MSRPAPRLGLPALLIAFALLFLATPAAAQPLVLQDALGRTVNLAAPAERVVVLEWTYLEDLLAVGATPVGAADPTGYGAWVDSDADLAGVTDVGTRQEPSLEAILALDPDLIVGVRFRHEAIVDRLEAIAPTLLFDPYPVEGAGDQYAEMEATFRTLAEAVGRSKAADAVLSELDAAFAALGGRLETAGRAGDEVLLVQAYLLQGAPQLRVFTDNALATQVLARLGLENAWPSAYAPFGFDTVGVEALVPVADADTLLYVVSDADRAAFDAALGVDPLWSRFDVVARADAEALAGDTWVFGGPESALELAERAVDALLD